MDLISLAGLSGSASVMTSSPTSLRRICFNVSQNEMPLATKAQPFPAPVDAGPTLADLPTLTEQVVATTRALEAPVLWTTPTLAESISTTSAETLSCESWPELMSQQNPMAQTDAQLQSHAWKPNLFQSAFHKPAVAWCSGTCSTHPSMQLPNAPV
jgi:hypothetical protein